MASIEGKLGGVFRAVAGMRMKKVCCKNAQKKETKSLECLYAAKHLQNPCENAII